MTLLVSVVSPEFSLGASDQRITATYLSRVRVVDEKLNKHIFFGTQNYVGNISYTGVAQWRLKGVRYRLCDIISDAICSVITKSPKLSEIIVHLSEYLSNKIPSAADLGVEPHFELHLLTRENTYPVNTITVISTYRTAPPWSSPDGVIYEWQLGAIKVFMKVLVEESDVVFGGMEDHIRAVEKDKLRHAVRSGADAFQTSHMASQIVEAVSKRTPTVGAMSVSLVLPAKGYVDTNLWRDTGEDIIGYMPRMIFPNGAKLGPSEFPVGISLITSGYLPKHSLFFKSIVQKTSKRRVKRSIFRKRTGKPLPSLMGLIGLGLYGSVVDGYEDFGLGGSSDE